MSSNMYTLALRVSQTAVLSHLAAVGLRCRPPYLHTNESENALASYHDSQWGKATRAYGFA